MAVVRLRLFAAAREAAGTANDEFEATTLGDLLEAAHAPATANDGPRSRQPHACG